MSNTRRTEINRQLHIASQRFGSRMRSQRFYTLLGETPFIHESALSLGGRLACRAWYRFDREAPLVYCYKFLNLVIWSVEPVAMFKGLEHDPIGVDHE